MTLVTALDAALERHLFAVTLAATVWGFATDFDAEIVAANPMEL